MVCRGFSIVALRFSPQLVGRADHFSRPGWLFRYQADYNVSLGCVPLPKEAVFGHYQRQVPAAPSTPVRYIPAVHSTTLQENPASLRLLWIINCNLEVVFFISSALLLAGLLSAFPAVLADLSIASCCPDDGLHDGRGISLQLHMKFLNKVALRIVNEVQGISLVTYNVTSKPPGTIELQ